MCKKSAFHIAIVLLLFPIQNSLRIHLSLIIKSVLEKSSLGLQAQLTIAIEVLNRAIQRGLVKVNHIGRQSKVQ